VCLAGVLAPFDDAADDVLRRFAGIRLSASTVLRSTEEAGQLLQRQLLAGRVPKPSQREPGWQARRDGELPAVYVGVDAFSVPMQGPDGAKAEHRMLYTGILYTPDKQHSRYLVDFDLDQVTAKLRRVAGSCGIGQVGAVIAITDGGNGIEEALQRAFADDVRTILDWYHAAEHVHEFGHGCFGRDSEPAKAWNHQAIEILYEQGGTALLQFLETWSLPPQATAEVAEEFRKLKGYFRNNEHRTDYPRYRAKGWDIGSGPTEAGCKIIGERLKGSGMRWVETGAEAVGALRALYVSGAKVWDGFWEQPCRPAA
jgi:hypothetical protein